MKSSKVFESMKLTYIPDCLLGKHPLIKSLPVFKKGVNVFTVTSTPDFDIVFPGLAFAPTNTPAAVATAEVYNQEPPDVVEVKPGSLLKRDTECCF